MGVGIEFFSSGEKIRTSKSDVLIYSGAGYEARTRFPASHELRSAIRRNPTSPLIKMRFAHGCRYRVLFVWRKNQDIQIGCPDFSIGRKNLLSLPVRGARISPAEDGRSLRPSSHAKKLSITITPPTRFFTKRVGGAPEKS